MRLGLVAPIITLALAAFPMAVPAQAPPVPLSIHVEAVLGEPTSVGARMTFSFNGKAVLAGLIEGESDVHGQWHPFLPAHPINDDNIPPTPDYDELDLSRGPLIEAVQILCTGTMDSAGNGSGRCASSGEVEGHGTWAGRIERSLVVDIYLQVVCPRCVTR